MTSSSSSPSKGWFAAGALLGALAGGAVVALLMQQGGLKQLKQMGKGKKASADFDASAFDRPEATLRRLRRAEAVLRDRIGSVAIVLERTSDSHNFAAVLRTAEGLGFQHVYLVSVHASVMNLEQPRKFKGKATWGEDAKQFDLHVGVGRGSTKWLTLHVFETAKEAIAALQADGFSIWATDLSQKAQALQYGPTPGLEMPERLAVVMGTEGSGISQEFVDAADARVFLPQSGFADSYNISVAAAMMMQHILFLKPSVVGSLPEEEKHQLRKEWYTRLARTPEEKKEFLALIDSPPAPFQDSRRHDEHRAPRMRPSDYKNMVHPEQYTPAR